MCRKRSEVKLIFSVVLGFLLITSTAFAQMTDATASQPRTGGVFFGNPSFPWAPSQNQTGKYRYLYYPGAAVYFDSVRELFFFNMDGQWIKSPTLPSELRPRLGEFVILNMDTSEPYQFHTEVTKYYPATGQARRSEIPASPPRVSRSVTPVQKEAPPQKTQAVPEQTRQASPPWASAPGEASYRYQYYPDAFVYYDTARNVYYYRPDGQWLESETLPAYIAENMGSPVSLDMNTDRPYQYHSEVVARYPHPGFNKNVQKIIKIEREVIYKD